MDKCLTIAKSFAKEQVDAGCEITVITPVANLSAMSERPNRIQRKSNAFIMKKIFIYTIILGSFGCSGQNDYKNPKVNIDKRVDILLNQMTLDEKVAQLYTYIDGQDGLNDPESYASDSSNIFYKNGTGSFFLGFKCNDATLFAERVNKIQSYFIEKTRLGIPVIIAGEGLHGFLAKGATSFPQNIASGCTFDTELIEKMYTVTAREMRAWGVHQVYCPNIDLGRDPRFGRIEETYGEDPYLTSQIGLAAVRGLQGREPGDLKNQRVIATLKHYAGHGEPMGGRNCASVGSINTTYFHENPLLPFEVAVKEGNALSVMVSYNDADGVPNHINKLLLNNILVNQFGFTGYVISDLFGVERTIIMHHVAKDKKEAALLCFNAGVDMELTRDTAAFINIKILVEEGKISEQRLNDAVARILRLKFLLGLFENPYVKVEDVLKMTNTEPDKALALEAAEKSAVLLKNKNVLPLKESGIKNLAVIGPMAATTHLGGYSQEPFIGVSILQGLQKFGEGKFNVSYAEGCKISITPGSFINEVNPVPNSVSDDMRLIAEAVKVASLSDAVVLVIGEDESFCREAWSEDHLGDRESLEMPGMQNQLVEALLKTGKPIVAVITGGRPLSFNFVAEKVPAIFQAWYLGQETGYAIANLLFGKANPSGKLCVTIPRSVGQLPCYYSKMPSMDRSYLLADNTPLYPFGFGLSYSSFEYSEPELSSPEITRGDTTVLKVKIKNTGSVAGTEVVQLYIRDEISSVVRPIIQLKDFKRVQINPGESKIVEFAVDNSKLSFFNANLDRVVEPGIFDLKVGGNSRDLKSIKLTLK
jgi:beta-glucosidase